MAGVTVSRVGERLVVVKTAAGDSAERVRSEARVLQALDHPGLVQVVDVSDSDDSVRLRTVFAGPDTWASRPLQDPIQRAAGIAAVAATLADIHARGVTHGSLTLEHIIRADDDRPVLCGLSGSRGDGPAERLADMVALAALIEQPPLPDHPATRALSALARRMQAGACDAPDVVREANRIAADSGPRTGGGERRRSRVGAAVVVAVAAGGTIAVAGATQLVESGLRQPTTSSAPRPEVSATTQGPQTEARPVRPADPVRPGDPGDPPPSAGIVLDHAGRRYRIGAVDDVVVLGDWDCDGDPTPAVLRPATGEIALFEDWPEPGGTISRPSSWTITDAEGLTVDADGSCDRLRVRTSAGSQVMGRGGSS